MKKQGISPRGGRLAQDLTTVKFCGATMTKKYFKEGFESENKQTWVLQGPPPGTHSNKGEITMLSSFPSRCNYSHYAKSTGLKRRVKQKDKGCCCVVCDTDSCPF